MTAQRVARTLRAVPANAGKSLVNPVTEVPEKLLKGSAVANTIRYDVPNSR